MNKYKSEPEKDGEKPGQRYHAEKSESVQLLVKTRQVLLDEVFKHTCNKVTRQSGVLIHA